MEKSKKKTFLQVLGRVSLIGMGGLIGTGIADWIREGGFDWSALGTRLISMVIVVLIFSVLGYKLQK